jgi:hypothetical protein
MLVTLPEDLSDCRSWLGPPHTQGCSTGEFLSILMKERWLGVDTRVSWGTQPSGRSSVVLIMGPSGGCPCFTPSPRGSSWDHLQSTRSLNLASAQPRTVLCAWILFLTKVHFFLSVSKGVQHSKSLKKKRKEAEWVKERRQKGKQVPLVFPPY